MQEAGRKLINIKTSTADKLDNLKAMPSESYDSVLIRIIEYIEEEEQKQYRE